MKKIIILTIAASLLILTGCNLNTNDQSEKIAKLEQQINEMQIKLDQKETVTTQAKQKSLVEYYKTMGQYFTLGVNKSFVQKDPEELGFKEIIKVKIACPANPDGPCGGYLLILSKESLHSGTQEFYLSRAGGAGYSYFGPFTDDLERLVEESKTIDALEE